MGVSLIAAVDENNGLGKNNSLLCHLPADLQHFKSITWGKPIIMGRNTFHSIGKILPGRMNIILSHQPHHIPGATVAHSFEAALELAQPQVEIMIAGGASVYEQAIPYADRIYLTVIHHQFDADVFFPTIDKKRWICSSQLERQRDEKNTYDMTFYEFQRNV